MDNSDHHENVAHWLALCDYDLETARVMLTGGRYLYVGFMCQQVAEKSLKAIIAKSGAFPPKIHNLMRLAELGNLLSVLTDEQKELLNELSPCAIEARYMGYKMNLAKTLTAPICQRHLQRTEEFLLWIKTRL